MSAYHLKPVRIFDRSNTDQGYDSEIQVHALNGAQHLKNGFKALAICWGIGILCIAIPVMHFVLVPGMAIVGVVMFFMRSKLKFSRPAFDIACPNCRTKIPIKAGPFSWPIREMCENCRADAVIDKR